MVDSHALNVHLPIDISKGQWIVAIPQGPNEAVAVMKVQQMMSLIPDPVASEDPKRVEDDPTMQTYASLRGEVQRIVKGAKLRNARKYAEYIVEGLQRKRPLMLPPITLYHPQELESVQLGNGVAAFCLPFGDFFVAIDGETQRIAWQFAAKELPGAMGAVVKITFHHGKSLDEARQGFYDFNTREVKPTAAVSIAMDSMDFATRVTRRVMDESDILRDRVNLQRRQLRRTDPEIVTISALRTGIVTTILGTAGLQVGSRPIDGLPDEVDLDAVESAVVEIWTSILEQLEDALDPNKRANSIASSASILAGIGVVAHRTIPSPPRKADVEELTIDEVLERLDEVRWERQEVGAITPKSAWDGIAGKFSPSGNFSVGGPKEVGHTVADALLDPSSNAGQCIRNGVPANG